MAFKIQGFVEIPSLIRNTKGVVSGIGELSPLAKTFARDKQFFSHDDYDDLALTVFTSTINKNYQVTPANLVEEILKVTKEVKLFDFADNFDAQYRAKFPTHKDPRHGLIQREGDVSMPAWVSFELQLESEIAEIKVWYVDAKFRNEFNGAEVKIVPPVSPVTKLKADKQSVEDALRTVQYAEQIEKIETAKDSYPPTAIEVIKLRWNHPTKPNDFITTDWTAICYGREATRYDVIINAIKQYLIDNSDFTVNEWRDYLPEIQFAKIYHIIPLWHKAAISSGPTTQNLYNPSIRSEMMVEQGVRYMPTVAEGDVRTYAEFLPILYKSLGIVIVGAEGNEEGQRWFTERYPDYTVIDINNQHADRISAATREAIVSLELLARQAEIDTGTNDLPRNIARNTISGITYLDLTVSGIIFRMVTKQSYLAKRGE